MYTKQILIWDYELKLSNSGGPSGYLYNIKEFLKSNPNKFENIHFISDFISKNNQQYINKENKFIKFLYNITFFKQRIDALRCVKRWNTQLKINDTSVDFNKFDIIHFHVCSDLLRTEHLLKNYKGKIILTSHSPQPTSYEIAENITDKFSLIRFLQKKYLIRKEIKSWNLAAKIMFPVKEATEPYRVNNNTRTYLIENKNKLLFCPSSILDISIKNTKIEICNHLNIPADSFIISFIGRHNIIKGYDQLKEIAKLILEKYSNVYFVIAGKEAPITRLEHKRWIELGWINYGNDLISASDLFILPNKETYFDLVALEVLRVGTPILMTNTGGNKHFSTYSFSETKGIYYFEYGDLNNAFNIIEDIIVAKQNNRFCEIRESNRQLFLSHFTMKSFLDRYLSCLEKLN